MSFIISMYTSDTWHFLMGWCHTSFSGQRTLYAASCWIPYTSPVARVDKALGLWLNCLSENRIGCLLSWLFLTPTQLHSNKVWESGVRSFIPLHFPQLRSHCSACKVGQFCFSVTPLVSHFFIASLKHDASYPCCFCALSFFFILSIKSPTSRVALFNFILSI